MTFQRIVVVIVSWPEISMAGVLLGYILWLRILWCALVCITGPLVLITIRARGKRAFAFPDVKFTLQERAKCPTRWHRRQIIWLFVVLKLLVVTGVLG